MTYEPPSLYPSFFLSRSQCLTLIVMKNFTQYFTLLLKKSHLQWHLCSFDLGGNSESLWLTGYCGWIVILYTYLFWIWTDTLYRASDKECVLELSLSRLLVCFLDCCYNNKYRIWLFIKAWNIYRTRINMKGETGTVLDSSIMMCHWCCASTCQQATCAHQLSWRRGLYLQALTPPQSAEFKAKNKTKLVMVLCHCVHEGHQGRGKLFTALSPHCSGCNELRGIKTQSGGVSDLQNTHFRMWPFSLERRRNHFTIFVQSPQRYRLFPMWLH